MEISVRSPLAIGVAAFTGAAAVVMTPSLAPATAPAPAPSLARVTDAVTMAALTDPLAALTDTAQLASNYLFTTGYSADPQANWPGSGIGTTWNTLLQLTFDPNVGFLPGYTNVGLIPDLQQGGFPAVRQVQNNWAGYLSSGDLAMIATRVAANGQAVLAAAQSLASEFATNLGRQQEIVMAAVNNAVSAVFAAFASGGLGPAFDAALSGFLGPTGVAGTVVNLTIGPGVQTDPADPTTFVPSLRTEARTAGQTFAHALTTANPPAANAAAIASRTQPASTDVAGNDVARAVDATDKAPLKSAAAGSPSRTSTRTVPSPAAAASPDKPSMSDSPGVEAPSRHASRHPPAAKQGANG